MSMYVHVSAAHMHNGGLCGSWCSSFSFCSYMQYVQITLHGFLLTAQNFACSYYHFILFIPFIGFSNWQLVLSHSSVDFMIITSSQTSVHLKDVTAISKQRTALVFPNAILIEAGDKKVCVYA